MTYNKHPFILFILFLVALFSCDRAPKNNIEPPFNYTLTGKGDTVLMFVHGLAINKTYWDQQIEEFKSDYTVITFDLPGHGASDVKRTDWGIEDYANDIIQLSTALDLENVVLIGHSMSGDVDLLAYQHIKDRVIGFIGVDNFQELGAPMSDTARLAVDAELQEFHDHYRSVAAGYAKTLFSDQTDSTVRKRVTDDFVRSDSLMIPQLLNSIIDNSQHERELLKDMKVPLILIDSDMFPINEGLLKENCGDGYKIWIIKGTGHYPMIEKPTEFNSDLRQALRFIHASK